MEESGFVWLDSDQLDVRDGNKGQMTRASFTALLFASLLSGCADEWTGFVYPDKNNLYTDITLGHFDSLEQCRASALKVIQLAEWETESDYECGLNCEVTGSKPYICGDTAK
jgi:hypothetical protein